MEIVVHLDHAVSDQTLVSKRIQTILHTLLFLAGHSPPSLYLYLAYNSPHFPLILPAGSQATSCSSQAATWHKCLTYNKELTETLPPTFLPITTQDPSSRLSSTLTASTVGVISKPLLYNRQKGESH